MPPFGKRMANSRIDTEACASINSSYLSPIRLAALSSQLPVTTDSPYCRTTDPRILPNLLATKTTYSRIYRRGTNLNSDQCVEARCDADGLLRPRHGLKTPQSPASLTAVVDASTQGGQ
ncbi:hypothetical protein TgHK011_006861 [Trichoderma gracile]|nr:hypothetical protein TgHK011_006861 [Trichoderma gracile]